MDWETDEFSLGSRYASTGVQQRLVKLRYDEARFVEIMDIFLEGWKNEKKKKPYVLAVFKILLFEEELRPYLTHRASTHSSLDGFLPIKTPGNEKLLFHGTTRKCRLGEPGRSSHLCSNQACSLCNIIRGSFDLRRCGTKHSFMRFGHGIYTSSVSSKADDYNLNPEDGVKFKTMLLNRVVVGRSHKLYKNATTTSCPPRGYHSILGKPGHDLNYEETVVYTNDAIRPAYLVVYGDNPTFNSKSRGMLARLFKTPLVS